MGAIRASSSMYGRNSFGPRAQFSPTLSKGACEIEIQKASVVCPVKVRPLASVIVPDAITGTRCPDSSKNSSMANKAAFRLRVSNVVSTSSRSTPPATSSPPVPYKRF